MGQYIDPAGRAKVARIALIVYVIAELIRIGVLLVSPADSTVVRTATLVVLVTMLGAMVATGYWIYRVNANAHSFADGLTITPGWNVGWFFVPIANLWKPFEGIKEVWQAGVDPAEWPRVETPELLRGWWGCWIAGNIASNSNLSALVIKYVGAEVALAIDLAASALLIAAAALLIRIVAELSDRQLIARAAHALA